MEFYDNERTLKILKPIRKQLELNINKYRECLSKREQDLKEMDLRIEELEFSLNNIKGERE